MPLSAQNVLQRKAPPAAMRLPYGHDPSQFGDLRLPKGAGPHPVVIFIHGGFWSNAATLDGTAAACAALTSAGAVTWNLEYRRVGDQGGGWPGTLDDIVHGAEHIVALASQYRLDLSRLVGVGHSAGGQLLLWLAAQRAVDLRGLVALAPISDLRQAYALNLGPGAVARFLGGSPDQVPQRYRAASPIQLLPISIAQRILHGTADNVVPFSMSERFVERSHNAKLIPLKGARHFDLVDPASAAWAAVQQNVLNWQF